MATLFLQYPACSTCQKAKKWLTENNIEYTNRLIVEENPTIEELRFCRGGKRGVLFVGRL